MPGRCLVFGRLFRDCLLGQTSAAGEVAGTASLRRHGSAEIRRYAFFVCHFSCSEAWPCRFELQVRRAPEWTVGYWWLLDVVTLPG